MNKTVNENISQQSVVPLELPSDAQAYRASQPLMMKVAALINAFSPRGKGAIPRWIGRKFGSKWKTSIVTDSGCHLAVDPANLDLFVTIANEGSWEPWIRRVSILAMQNGGVMFDVGANAGAISNEVGLACPDAVIKSFEPQSELAPLVAVSASLNDIDRIEVFPVAVGDHDGVVKLHKPAHALHASLMSSGEVGESTVDCPLVTLDNLVASGQLPAPSFIKVDVEGGELGVLKGALTILKQHQPVVIFEANDSAERFGYDRNDLLDLFRQCGDYQFFNIAPGDVLACPQSRVTDFQDAYERLP